jgi:cytochrome c
MPSKHFLFILFPVLLTGWTEIPDAGPMVNRADFGKASLISQSVNHAPVVKILQPLHQAAFAWNDLVPYDIHVSDAEDGESKYEEIQSSEVLVKLKYAENSAEAAAILKLKVFPDTAGVNGMLVSNCFNCHAVKSKKTGPSFQEISRRYPFTDKNIDLLIAHIQKGSTGIWGKEVMPTHPELADPAVRKMVKWILRYTDDPRLNFFTGFQGTMPLNIPGMKPHGGFFIVTALYTDHGTTDEPEKKIAGSDQVLIRVK